MILKKNIVVPGSFKKPIVLDCGYKQNGVKKPVVIFAHGFKGFKDWGHFNLLMEHFIANDCVFVKFNFSHNGGTVEQPIDFPDLEAFGNNNYTKELGDLKTVVDWVENNQEIPAEEFDANKIYLIGHSRGGGISVIAANEDARIKKLICWAPVSDLVNRFNDAQMFEWKKQGVIYVYNARTEQQMPLYYQMAEDTLGNKERFEIEKAAKELSIPHLIIHGTGDKSVNVSEGRNIHKWSTASEIFVLEGADHTFGAVHPYLKDHFPKDAKIVIEKTLSFIHS